MRITRLIAAAVKYLLITAVACYVLDVVVFQVRLLRGHGMQTMQVDQFLQTPLKGNKVEMDYLGTGPQSCAVAALPQYAGGVWNAPCWWLRRNATKWQ